MKSVFQILFIFLIHGCVYAQTGTFYDYHYYNQKRVDSLQLLFKSTRNDSVIMAVSRDLGLFYGESNSDSAFYFQSLQLNIAERLGQKLWMADANDILGYIETKRGNYTSALQHFLAAIKLAEDIKTEKNIWRVTKFSQDANPQRARLTSLANIYNDLGLLYQAMSNMEKELEWFNKSISVGKKINDPIVLSYSYGNLGAAYLNLGNADTALQLLHQSLAYAYSAGFMKFIGTNTFQVGNIYLEKNKYDSAKKYYQQTINISLAANNTSSKAYGYTGYANLFDKLNQPDSGIYYAGKALKMFTEVVEPAGKLLSLQAMASLFKRKGRYDSAFYYQQMAMGVKDSLYNADKLKQFEKIGFAQQLKVEELEKEKLIIQNQNRTNAFVTGSIVFLLIGLLLYRNNRQKKKANFLLQKEKERVETTLSELTSTQSQLIQSEKMASLGELTAGIAHEIQNPLNFVNNFSEVSTELIEELQTEKSKVKSVRDEQLEDEILNDIKQNLEKINHHGKRAADIVKGMLQHSSSGSGKKEPTDINALADEYLRLAYHGLRAKDKSFNAAMKTDFDESIGNINIIPQDIGRVILNLITNAFYVVNEKSKQGIAGYQPTVEVNTKKEGNKVLIAVKDNGNGIPQKILDKIFQPFFSTNLPGRVQD
jgi:two-component system, NtrC family, sensor kinase